MLYIKVAFKVKDFNDWKVGFDTHEQVRTQSGSTGVHYIMQNVDNPNDVTVLLEWKNLDRARQFANDPELKEAMQKAGVEGKPEFQFVTSAN